MVRPAGSKDARSCPRKRRGAQVLGLPPLKSQGSCRTDTLSLGASWYQVKRHHRSPYGTRVYRSSSLWFAVQLWGQLESKFRSADENVCDRSEGILCLLVDTVSEAFGGSEKINGNQRKKRNILCKTLVRSFGASVIVNRECQREVRPAVPFRTDFQSSPTYCLRVPG
ncbi:hypothetical protein MJT46_015455 [Ovis ammon polii x Ovis aries]|nr:hypothetical protein MJT46_015455 [Ovis ammon polii x Ovis aries]